MMYLTIGIVWMLFMMLAYTIMGILWKYGIIHFDENDPVLESDDKLNDLFDNERNTFLASCIANALLWPLSIPVHLKLVYDLFKKH